MSGIDNTEVVSSMVPIAEAKGINVRINRIEIIFFII
jgi:hypothetical protein